MCWEGDYGDPLVFGHMDKIREQAKSQFVPFFYLKDSIKNRNP